MGEEFHYGVFAGPDTPLPDATAALTQLMLDRAAITAGDDVLDVGCGTGRQSCDLAANHGAKVLGITTSEAGVAAATELATSRRLEASARFEVRDGMDNQLPDSSFDVVWALESSHLMRDRPALLAEAVRVLRPGGRFVLCDIIRHREIPFAEVRERRDDFAVLRAAFGDAHMHPLSQYADTLTELGADVTDQTDLTEATLGTFKAWRDNTVAHETEIVELIGRQATDDFIRSTEVLEAFWKDGTLGYGILSAVKS